MSKPRALTQKVFIEHLNEAYSKLPFDVAYRKFGYILNKTSHKLSKANIEHYYNIGQVGYFYRKYDKEKFWNEFQKFAKSF